MNKGDVTFSRLSFSIPGADIGLAGRYNIDSGDLDFRGKLTMQAKLSQTVTGVKSFFLKAVDPFFKGQGGKGSVLPIKICVYAASLILLVRQNLGANAGTRWALERS